MSEFEVFAVVLSFVLGLGVAQLLTGVVEAIRHRRTTRLHWLPFLWVYALLLFHVNFLFSALWFYADDRTFLWHTQDLVSAFLLFLSGGLVLPPAGGAGQPRLDAHFAEDGRLALLPLGLFLLLGIPYLLEGGVPLLDPNHWVLMALLGCAGVAYLRGGRVRAGATVAFALVTTWAFVFVWVRPGA